MSMNESVLVNSTHSALSDIYDPLTDLYNRHLFVQVSDALLRISIRQKMPVCIAMISLDDCDEMEHAEMELLVRRSAELLKKVTRDSDVLAHFDKDKFALLLYNCSQQSSKMVADRVHHQIKEHIEFGDQPVSISIGLAEFDINLAGTRNNLSDQLVEDALDSMMPYC